ncbi:MAG: alpha/beta hydrolase [Bacteroidota bacterium]
MSDIMSCHQQVSDFEEPAEAKPDFFGVLRMTAAFFLLLVLAVSCSYLPEDEDLAGSNSFTENTEYIRITPVNTQTEAVFLFLPGGLVDAHAYIPLMQMVADNGIGVIIPKFSANLGMLELSKAMKIVEEMPEVKSWYIGGHSLGGIVAQISVYEHSELFNGLIFMGVYPAENYPLSDWNKNVLSIYASNDGLSTPDKITGTREFLPEAIDIASAEALDTMALSTPSTLFLLIQGGNHSQFGSYGFQKNDNKADISAGEQHTIVSQAISNFIFRNEEL